MFDDAGKLIRELAKPTGKDGLQAAGPSVDIAFEHGLSGGRLFATNSNQATHAAGQNNSSRIVVVDPQTGLVTPFITGLPTGDHPTEQLAFKDGWIYWSQGSTTNSGVVGRDNGGGTNQQDIPCQDIMLSSNVFDSGGSPDVMTSGYSAFGVQRKGATVHAFESALHHGVCDGAILRARLDADNPEDTIEPYSWGYRNDRLRRDSDSLRSDVLRTRPSFHKAIENNLRPDQISAMESSGAGIRDRLAERYREIVTPAQRAA